MIVDKICETAKAFSDKTAIIFNEHHIRYGQLDQIIHQLANGLRRAGVQKGDRVALLMPNLPHFVFSYYAIMRGGAIVVPINYMMEDNEFEEALKVVAPRAIIYWAGFKKHLTSYLAKAEPKPILISLGEAHEFAGFNLLELIASFNSDWEAISQEPSETAIIQFTSGVTDPPKGVELSHENLLASVSGTTQLFRFNENDVVAAALPLFFIFSQNFLLNSALSRGCTVVLHPKIDYAQIAQSIDEHHVSVLAGSPQFYDLLLKSAPDSMSGRSLKYCLSSWHPLPAELDERFQQRFGVPLLNCYSITETSGLVAGNHPSLDRKPGSLGLRLPDIDIQVHDESGEPLDPNQVGEIAIQGKVVMKGYWNAAENNQSTIKNGWYYTGDLGQLDEQGNIYLVCKKADVIIKSGFPIYTTEIEQLLLQNPKVKEAVVLPIPHPNHKEDVQAFIALKDNEVATAEEIIEYCRNHMPVYKCPTIVRFFPVLPRTKMGRIFKRKLRELSNHSRH
ncbi:MAG: AMP-binding protein [candidate division KSB1 bacterium]|nr:AMP-binding protein [candidate division KSB1 bacterium]MDZ7334540.1 AMP-binding protein [candidate division KSB1 bacterium]MDZ7358701.1 AMP-binding protein [candidate division KSB1 bacterium]MDZ7400847.1 AMP-binding protein [candidate division KSB1 bacterium]